MRVSIFVNFGTVIPSMDDQLLLHMLKNMIILYFRILKKECGIGSIVIRKFVNTLSICENVMIEVVVDHREHLMLLNYYH